VTDCGGGTNQFWEGACPVNTTGGCPVVADTITITYAAGPGGAVREGVGELKPEVVFRLPQGESGNMVTAAAAAGFTFVKWSDGGTAATRFDNSMVNVTFTAEFQANTVVVVPDSFTVTYSAGFGGRVAYDGGDGQLQIAFKAPEGTAVPAVRAIPNEGYTFIRWLIGGNEESTAAIRSGDVVTAVANRVIMAEFSEIIEDDPDPDKPRYTITYMVAGGVGGGLVIGSAAPIVLAPFNREAGTSAPTVTAVPDADYNFVGWSDGSTEAARTDIAVADTVFTAHFELKESAVMTPGKQIPGASDDRFTLIAPVVITAGEVFAGPNPAARGAAMNFFRTGKTVSKGTLSVYTATGNLVRKIRVSDSNAAGGQRTVATWDLKDSKGRTVAEGTYLVRGTLTTADGKKERVSLRVGVK